MMQGPIKRRGVLWDVDSYGKTAEGAIKEFCRSYWGETRKHTKIISQPDGSYEFQLRGGLRKYNCRLVDNVPTVWRISWFA